MFFIAHLTQLPRPTTHFVRLRSPTRHTCGADINIQRQMMMSASASNERRKKNMSTSGDGSKTGKTKKKSCGASGATIVWPKIIHPFEAREFGGHGGSVFVCMTR